MLIVEVLYDPAAGLPDPGGEWALLHNRSAAPLQLTGWRLRDSRAETALPPFRLSAGEFAMIGASEALGLPGLPPAGLQIALPGRIGNGLRNDGDSLALVDSAGTVIDALSWGDDRSIFDPPAPPAGSGISLRRMATVDTDSAADWILANAAPPTATGATETATPAPGAATAATGTSVQPAASGAGNATAGKPTVGGVGDATANVVLSEVAPGDGWVELYNRGPSPANVNGWSLSENTASIQVKVARAQPIPAHGFIVVRAKSLRLDAEGAELVLRRVDGTTADLVELGPVRAGFGWSRYPAHGGVWTAGTPLTLNAFNLLAPDASAEASANEAADRGTATVAASVNADDRSRWVMILASAAVLGAAWSALRRRWLS